MMSTKKGKEEVFFLLLLLSLKRQCFVERLKEEKKKVPDL